MRLRPLGLMTGSSAMNSAQEKSDCCDFVPRTRRRNTPSFAPGQAVADTCGRTQSRAAFSDSRPNHSDPFTPFSQSEKLVTDTLSNGYLLETSHFKHIVYPDNNCVNDHVHGALIDGVYPGERRLYYEQATTTPVSTTKTNPHAAVRDVRLRQRRA